jgi:RsiW-degrading membrane proteinase PrsW (M82 family)
MNIEKLLHIKLTPQQEHCHEGFKWLIISTFIGVALAGLIKGVILEIKIYHTSKLYRISKLPKPIVNGFLRGYIENEFEEQLKNFPDRKDLN